MTVQTVTSKTFELSSPFRSSTGLYSSKEEAELEVYNELKSKEINLAKVGWSMVSVDSWKGLYKFVVKYSDNNSQKDNYEIFANQYENNN